MHAHFGFRTILKFDTLKGWLCREYAACIVQEEWIGWRGRSTSDLGTYSGTTLCVSMRIIWDRVTVYRGY